MLMYMIMYIIMYMLMYIIMYMIMSSIKLLTSAMFSPCIDSFKSAKIVLF